MTGQEPAATLLNRIAEIFDDATAEALQGRLHPVLVDVPDVTTRSHVQVVGERIPMDPRSVSLRAAAQDRDELDLQRRIAARMKDRADG